jgi:hypothetical protein
MEAEVEENSRSQVQNGAYYQWGRKTQTMGEEGEALDEMRTGDRNSSKTWAVVGGGALSPFQNGACYQWKRKTQTMGEEGEALDEMRTGVQNSSKTWEEVGGEVQIAYFQNCWKILQRCHLQLVLPLVLPLVLLSASDLFLYNTKQYIRVYTDK